MRLPFLRGLVVGPLFFVACATGGASEEPSTGEPVEGEGNASGAAGAAGKGGAGGKGGASTGKGGAGGGSAGTSSGQAGTLGGGTGGAASGAGGKAGSAAKGGAAGKAGAAGTGGASGTGGAGGKGGGAGAAGGTPGGGGQGGEAGASGKGGTGGTSPGGSGGVGGLAAGGAGTGGASAGGAGVGGIAQGGSGGSSGAGGSGQVDACAAAIKAMSIDFESSASNVKVGALDGFSGDSSWPYVQFEYGTPSAAKAASGGPAKCAGGAKCLANDISEDYVQCGRSFAITPTWDLSACAGRTVRLSFDHWYEFSVIQYAGTTYYDGGALELSGTAGATWSQGLAAYTGTININGTLGGGYSCNSPNKFYVDGRPGFIGTSAGAWVHEDVTIAANLLTDKFAARFLWSSGVSYKTTSPTDSQQHSSAGWYLDNIAVTLAP